jgi:hypothetical protein
MPDYTLWTVFQSLRIYIRDENPDKSESLHLHCISHHHKIIAVFWTLSIVLDKTVIHLEHWTLDNVQHNITIITLFA